MPDPSPSSTPLAVQIIFLLVLILINAFFALAEMAIVSVNKNKIKVLAQDGNKKAIALQKLLDEPNKFLSTIQVAITLAGFLSSASAAVALSDDLGAFLAKFGIPYSNQISVVLVTMILSYVTLVLGELYPKRIALQHSEPIAMAVVKPLSIISKITKPFVWFISASVNVVLRLTRQSVDVEDEEFSEDEVMSMLEVGQETGVLKEEGKNPFILDSKEPTGNFRDFIMDEVRYSSLVRTFPETAEELFQKCEKEARERYETYKNMAEEA